MTGDPLGSFETLARHAWSLALIVALGFTVVLQRLQSNLGRAEGSFWWASNGRDLINALSLGAVGATLWAMGYPGPSALLLAATILLVLNLLETVLLRGLGPVSNALASLLIVSLLVSPLVFVPERVNGLLNQITAHLFS